MVEILTIGAIQVRFLSFLFLSFRGKIVVMPGNFMSCNIMSCNIISCVFSQSVPMTDCMIVLNCRHLLRYVLVCRVLCGMQGLVDSTAEFMVRVDFSAIPFAIMHCAN